MFGKKYIDYRDSKHDTTPIFRKPVEEKPFPSVELLALIGLMFALVVILVKTLYFFGETPENKFNLELNPLHLIIESGEAIVSKSWNLIVIYRRTLQAIAIGTIATYCTWMCVFLDSHTPGVYPPSPLSPRRGQSGVTIHSVYAFTLMLGVIVGSYVYYKDLIG